MRKLIFIITVTLGVALTTTGVVTSQDMDDEELVRQYETRGVTSEYTEDKGLVSQNETWIITFPSTEDDQAAKIIYGGVLGLNVTCLLAVIFAILFIGAAAYYAYYCYPVHCPDRFRKEYDATNREPVNLQVANLGNTLDEELEKLNTPPKIKN